jgi:antirestriction protein ArdC
MAKFKKSTAPKIDVYERVTNAIIEQLEKGVRPWQKPWTVGNPGGGVSLPLRANGKPYRGINVFLLWSEASAKGFTSPYWMTFNQAKEFGGNVKGGEKAAFVIYANRINKPNKEDPEKTDSIFFMKGYYVFNAEQCENLPPRFQPAPPVVLTPEEAEAKTARRIAHADDYFTKIGADVRHGGDRAFYSPAGDFIQLPPFESFKDPESYYATKGHEHVHWTGASTRLNRDFLNRFGSEAYAAEELVAELGSAFLCAELGLTLEPRDDHASYLAGWLKVLKGDKRFIVQAASAAQKAVGFLNEAAGVVEEPAEAGSEGELAEAA